jgi:hypothetical protein
LKIESEICATPVRLRPKADCGGQEATPDIRYAEVLAAEVSAKADGPTKAAKPRKLAQHAKQNLRADIIEVATQFERGPA